MEIIKQDQEKGKENKDAPKKEAPKPSTSIEEVPELAPAPAQAAPVAAEPMDMKQMSEMIMQLQAALIAQKNDVPTQHVAKTATADDMLEEPVKFYTFATSHFLHSYKDRQNEIIPPYGRIKFEVFHRWFKQGALRGTGQQIAISMATIHTKSELQFMQNHPSYGIAYFDSFHDATSVVPKEVEKKNTAMQQLGRLTDHEIMSRVRSYRESGKNIQISNDLSAMRSAVADQMVKDWGLSEKTNRQADAKKWNDEINV